MVRLRAAIYARQSITREGSASLDVQIEACRDTAKRLKIEVAAELVEAPSTSGYRNRGRSRPKFQKLLQLIRAGEVDCVVAYKPIASPAEAARAGRRLSTRSRRPVETRIGLSLRPTGG